MAELNERIIKLLKSNPQGLKARKIALQLCETRQRVNHCLYDENNKDIFQIDKHFAWHLIAIPEQDINTEDSADTVISVEDSNPVLKKLNGKDTAKIFSVEEFIMIAKANREEQFVHSNPMPYTTRQRNIVLCDSGYEKKMLEYLERNDLVQRLAGQLAYLQYSTNGHNVRKYYPDIFALTKDGHIAVIEVKPVSGMTYYLNLKKYSALKAWCIERGYEYMMVDPASNFMTIDELSGIEVDAELERTAVEYLKNHSHFSDDNGYGNRARIWNEMFPEIDRVKLRLMLHALVIKYEWKNRSKYGLRVYK